MYQVEARALLLHKSAQRNASDDNRVIIRVPKAWQLGQALNKEKLSAATKEICEQIKKMLESGEIGPGKAKLRLERLLKDLVEPKAKRVPKSKPDPDK